MDKKDVQPSISLGRAWSKFPEVLFQIDIFQRPHGNHQRMAFHQEFQTPGGEGNQRTSSRPTQISSGFTPFRKQQISGQESPFFTIPGSFQEKTRIQGQKQDILQPKAERVRRNDPEAVELGERGTQEPEIVVNTSRISGPNNRNITPTVNEHSFVTPESNLKSEALWLKMSQFAEQTQKQLEELQESHERMKTLKATMEKIVKTLQEGHSKLSKASEETNKRLNEFFEEQHH
ncbi:hypothetical protein O181_053751 [Austropuccinia psidii MF-1]|uniref:Uncharacterized protein n=1 Tax=Austropuccinia psidii MF-1 TaxID=1389203 RepID=A0A9Q3E135_9BASI|nr:hypothetical protein [Austropuccinia psidii MF-1]